MRKLYVLYYNLILCNQEVCLHVLYESAIRVFTQQVILVIFLLSMVAVLREDINRLVIRPVQYMLKIVSRCKYI